MEFRTAGAHHVGGAPTLWNSGINQIPERPPPISVV